MKHSHLFMSQFWRCLFAAKLLISVISFYSKTNSMHQCIKFILFCNDTLHVPQGLSVHHQEFKTVHTATGICQTDTASEYEMELQFHLVLASKQTAVSV